MKKFLTGICCAMTLLTVSGVAANASVEDVNNNLQQNIELTPNQEEKVQQILQEVKRLNSLPEKQRNEEISQIFAEAEGLELQMGEQTGIMSRAAAQTEAKIINGGINSYAYNKEGVKKLVDMSNQMATTYGIINIAYGFVSYFPAIPVKVATAILAPMAGVLNTRFRAGCNIMRTKTTRGGFRITLTDTLDITSKGINAYA